MRTIEINLEYACFPVWVFDEKGALIDTAIPEEIEGADELSERFESLQERFDSTFVDTDEEFSAKGFETEEAKRDFYLDLNEVVAELEEKCAFAYKVIKRY